MQPTTNLPTNDSTALQFDCKPLLSLNKQWKNVRFRIQDWLLTCDEQDAYFHSRIYWHPSEWIWWKTGRDGRKSHARCSFSPSLQLRFEKSPQVKLVSKELNHIRHFINGYSQGILKIRLLIFRFYFDFHMTWLFWAC